MKSYINFQLLDDIKDKCSEGDGAAKELVASFAQRKAFESSDILACISCKETTLALLSGMIFFLRSNSLPPIESDRYQWWEHISEFENPADDIRVTAINIIRNAIAHWDEGDSGVEFLKSEGATQFSSRIGKFKITDNGLHLLIMQMYGYSQSA